MVHIKTKIFGILLVLSVLFFSGFVSAAPISDDLHLNLQVTDSSGNVQTGTYSFVFNISTTSDCSNVVYSKSDSLTTDSRGIISYYLDNVNLDFNSQYYLCYYRDGELINSSKLARNPYAFSAKNISLSGINVDSNLDLSGYNLTADYLFGDGSGLTNLNISELDLSDYFTKTEILNFDYYNSTDFDISDYYLKSNPFGFYNLSDFDINDYYQKSNPYNYLNSSTINVSSINYWNKSGNNLYYNDGNVGINTTTPGHALTLGTGNLAVEEGNIYLKGGNRIYFDYGVSNDYAIRKTSDTLYFDTGGDYNFANGNVGIGTDNPSSKLQLGSGVGNPEFRIYGNDSGAPKYGQMYVDSSGSFWVRGEDTYLRLDSGGYIQMEKTVNLLDSLLFVGDTNLYRQEANYLRTNDNLIIDGNVGIGTTTPQNTLNVIGDGNFTGELYANGNRIDNLNATGLIINWSGETDLSDYFTKAEILNFNYYNSTDFDINDYYLKSNPFGFYNSTTLNSLSQLSNDLNFVNYTKLSEFENDLGIGNWSADKTNYYNKTESDNLYLGTGDETNLNVNNSQYLDGYDSSFFMPLNTSVSGQFDFNGGWTSDGLSIIDGNIYAQAGYFYQVNSLQVSNLEVNGSLIPDMDNQFDLGNSTMRWNDAYFGGNAQVDGDLNVDSNTLYVDSATGRVGIGTDSPSVAFEVSGDYSRLEGLGSVITGFRIRNANSNQEWAIGSLGGTPTGYGTSAGSFIVRDWVYSKTPLEIEKNTPTGTLYLDNAGKIGINTTTPQNTLNVVGDGNFTGNLYSNGEAVLTSSDSLSVSDVWVNESGDTMTGSLTMSGTDANIILGSNYLSGDGGDEGVFVDSSGNVGIGTNTPTEKLDVNGSILSSGALAGYYFQDRTNNSVEWSWYSSGDKANLWRNGFSKNYLTVDSNSGNVGINNTSPSKELDVTGDIRASNAFSVEKSSTGKLKITALAGAGRDFPGIWFGSNADSPTTSNYGFLYDSSYGTILNTPAAQSFYFRVGNTNSLVIDGDRNVGIGTTTPQNKLNVIGDGNFTGNLYSNGEAVLTSSDSLSVSDVWVNESGDTMTGSLTMSGTDANIVLGSNYLSGDGGDEGVFVDSSGNVGINNTSPSKELDVTGDIRASNAFSVEKSSTGKLKITALAGAGRDFPGIWFGSNADSPTTSNYGFLYDSSYGTILNTPAAQSFYFRVGNTNSLVIDGDRNVGINTTTPQNTLNVVGDGNFTGELYANGNRIDNLNATGLIINWSSEVDLSDYFTKTEILNFNYYNSTDFDINDYYLKSNPFGFYNSTTLADAETDPKWTGNLTSGLSSNLILNGNYLSGDGGDEGVFVASNGFVGIGTSSPKNILNVVGAANITSDLYLGTQLRFDYAETSKDIFRTTGNGTKTFRFDDGAVRFWGYNTTTLLGGTVLKLDPSNRNVGIGTDSPSSSLKLDVEGQIGATAYCDEAGNNCVDIANVISSIDDVWVNESGDTMTGSLTMSGTAANIILGSNYLSGDGGDEGVFVDSSGNVGIGGNTPGAKLAILSDPDANGIFLSGKSGNDNSPYLLFGDNYEDNVGAAIKGSNEASYGRKALSFYVGGDSTWTSDVSDLIEAMRIDYLGKVGIGTTTPTTKLDVNGTANVENLTLSSEGSIFIEGGDMVFRV